MHNAIGFAPRATSAPPPRRYDYHPAWDPAA